MYGKIRAFVGQVSEDEIFMYAAQGAFYMITASIPFMMLFLALLQFILPLTEQDIVMLVKSVVPQAMKSLAETVMNEVISKSVAVISITGITTVWSASRGVAAVERGIKNVYGVKQKRNFFERFIFAVFYTLLLIVALLATLLIIFFGESIYYGGFLGEVSAGVTFLRRMQWIMYFAVFNIFFIFLYKVLAGKGTEIKDHISGAIFTTIGWLIFSVAFSVYVERFSNYSYIYGSLSVIVMTMLWLYSCMIILLMGAEINMFVKRKGWR